LSSYPVKKKKIMIIAGESSGDFLGSRLISQLKKIDPTLEFAGVGGDLMKREGLKSLAPMEILSIMGFTQIFKSIIKIFRLRRKLINKIKTGEYLGIVTIDAPGFSFWFGKKIKKMNVSHIHYVAPTVWAWKKNRAAKITKFLDAILCLFPFELPYFEKEGLKSFFVGHPLIEKFKISSQESKERYLKKFKLLPHSKILCILPGSRSSELKYHTAIFLEAARDFCKKQAYDAIFIPTISGKEKLLKELIKGINIKNLPPIYIQTDSNDRPLLYQSSTIALAASGTVTLELACSLTPMVVAYKVSKLNALIAKLFLKIKYVSMVNILYKKKIIPELLQDNCTPLKLAKSLSIVAEKPKEQLKYMENMSEFLSLEKKMPSKRAAEVIAQMWSLPQEPKI